MMKRMIMLMLLRKMVEVDDVEDAEVEGEEDDDVENDDVNVEEEGDDDIEDDDVEAEDRSQDRDPHFVRAWSRNAPGHFRRDTMCENLQIKCHRPRLGLTLCEPAQSKCTWTFQKSYYVRELTGKIPD